MVPIMWATRQMQRCNRNHIVVVHCPSSEIILNCFGNWDRVTR